MGGGCRTRFTSNVRCRKKYVAQARATDHVTDRATSSAATATATVTRAAIASARRRRRHLLIRTRRLSYRASVSARASWPPALPVPGASTRVEMRWRRSTQASASRSVRSHRCLEQAASMPSAHSYARARCRRASPTRRFLHAAHSATPFTRHVTPSC